MYKPSEKERTAELADKNTNDRNDPESSALNI